MRNNSAPSEPDLRLDRGAGPSAPGPTSTAPWPSPRSRLALLPDDVAGYDRHEEAVAHVVVVVPLPGQVQEHRTVHGNEPSVERQPRRTSRFCVGREAFSAAGVMDEAYIISCGVHSLAAWSPRTGDRD